MYESLQDSAKRTGFPYQAIREWCHKGYITWMRATDKPKSRIMVLKDSVDQYIRQKAKEAKNESVQGHISNLRRIPE